MKTGILGGTFDPIHNGHLAIAEKARAYLNLTEVIFIPAGKPWMKSDRPILSANHRMEMIKLAIEDRPYFRLSTTEVEHRGTSYTVDTIAKLKTRSTEASDFYFIIGWDNLARITLWKDPLKLIKLCFLVAVPRPGYDLPDIKKLEAEIPGIAKKIIFTDKPRVDISATDIRHRVAQGLSISGLVPEKVAVYIKKNGLYLKP